MDTRFGIAALTPTLPLQIADRIGARIVDGELEEGERLKEVELAAAFEVSRTTVREALRILETRGLVRITPQRGAQVTALSLSEMENLFEIRAVLLGLASQRVAERAGAGRDRAIRAGLAALASAHPRAAAYARASAAMVALIGELSGNEQLAQMNDSFAQRIFRYTRLGLATQARRDRSLRCWKHIVGAILRNEGDRAGALHRALVLENRDEAKRVVEGQQGARHARRATL
jgi:DNA-binding GntR family transcriptional regulator